MPKVVKQKSCKVFRKRENVIVGQHGRNIKDQEGLLLRKKKFVRSDH